MNEKKPVKPDDSSLTPQEFQTVLSAARGLLDRADGWGTFPTPVNHLVETAGLEIQPLAAFDESAMRRYIREAGEKAGELLKRALDKVLGILDVHANVVHVDPTLYVDRQTFLKLHETGHSELPHQRSMFRWVQDCKRHLDPGIASLFEREANTFARLVLFQDNAFALRTLDELFGIKVPMKHGRAFGASLYASFREYVRRHHKACAVIVLEPVEVCPQNGPSAPVRRIEMSDSFIAQFGSPHIGSRLTPSDTLMLCVPFEPQKMTRPRAFELSDRNGDRHEFLGEGFRTNYNVFILIHQIASLPA